jgi:hypothetical protein
MAFVPVTPQCVMDAARLQQVPPALILGLLKTEGGKLGSESPNSDGSYDLGPMQVNDRVWVPVVAKLHFHGDRDTAREALRDHGCYNVNIGAWIFRQYVDEANGDYAKAVGYYNSHNPVHMARYQKRFADSLKTLFGLR